MVSAGARLKIAVVGGGISGITAAHVLSRSHDVTLIERNQYLGGHTNTRVVSDPRNPELAVDTGFIVCNRRNYPSFYKLLAELGVSLQDSDMSFGYVCEDSGLQYMGPALRDFMAAPRNLLKREFLGMIREQWRFNRRALGDLRRGRMRDIPLESYLREVGASEYFVRNYLTPLIASIWSGPGSDSMQFPAQTFAAFFDNHGMLELRKRPQWQTIVGGSHSYVSAFRHRFSGSLRLSAPALSIRRGAEGIALRLPGAEPERFDKLVLATHADEALGLLEDPSEQERRLLGSWRYNLNRAVLHTDRAAVSGPRRLWAAWNYRRRRAADSGSPVAITYFMNRLQRLGAARDYFVTLNYQGEFAPGSVLYDTEYTHPVYTPSSVESQAGLRALNGTNGTYYCGAYMRYGFHEDGVRSALDVASCFGIAA